MSELMAIGASHKTAGVAVRERIALTSVGAERLMRELVEEPEIQEAVVLSTCNRTELYLVVGDAVEAETAVLGRLARRAGVRPTELLEGIYSLRNCDAARHLYRVTSGLESMVVGEAEVQGQVKRAYEAALATQSTGPLTNKLFRAALATGKRVRTDTAISVGRASVASVAVDAARDALGDLGSRHVLIIGAGETAEGTARALHEQGVRTMFVANRRRERAIELAQRFGGETVAFDALPDELSRADIVVASTSSPHLILGAEELAMVMPERAGRPLLLIDLAVPRDIDPACAELPGVTLSDIDDLQRQVDRQQLVRRAEARKAEGIVEEEIQTFAGWLGSLEVMPTLAALRTRGDEVVDRLLTENEGRWESLSPPTASASSCSRARPSSGCCTSPRCGSASSTPSTVTRASSCCASCSASTSRRRRSGPRAARSARCAARRELTPLRVGTRGSALALVQARWVADRLDGRGDRRDRHLGRPGARRRRQVPLGRRDRGGAGRGRDRPRGALGQGRPGASWPTAARSWRRRRARARWTSWSSRRAPRRRTSGALDAASALAEPARGARVGTSSLRRPAQLLSRAARPRGGRAARQRRHAAAQARRRRGRRHRARRRRARAARARARRATPLDFVPAPGQGTLALEARVDDERVRAAVQGIHDAGNLPRPRGRAGRCARIGRDLSHARRSPRG